MLSYEYIFLFVGFIATIIGVVGKTTVEGKKFPAHITWTGWTAITLAIASLVVSAIIQENQKVEKSRFQFWAMRELEFATYKLLEPYMLITDPAEESDRYKLTQSLMDAGVFETFATIAMSDIGDSRHNLTYAEISTRETEIACKAMGDILSRYSGFLSSETVELITKIRTSPWAEIMLTAERNWTRGTTQERTHPMFGKYQRLRVEKINEFALHLNLLESHIAEEMSRVCGDLNLVNPPPAFLLPLNR